MRKMRGWCGMEVDNLGPRMGSHHLKSNESRSRIKEEKIEYELVDNPLSDFPFEERADPEKCGTVT